MAKDDLTGFYKENGRIPWADIADNPSNHFAKKSRPECDFKLEEPSYMKSEAVNAWLKHWLKMQKKGKRPLVLKTKTDPSSETRTTVATTSKGKGKKKAYIEESDDAEDAEDAERSDSEKSRSEVEKSPTPECDTAREKKQNSNVLILPASPRSAGSNHRTRRTFLKSLSDDKNYQLLLRLLVAAKVSCYWHVVICPNDNSRLVQWWKEVHLPGCHGHRQTTIFPRNSMI